MTSQDTSFELFVAGAGPSYSDRPGALGASYLVRSADLASYLLLDLGQGAFPNVAGEVPPERLLATLISHLHPDHFVDLVSFRHYLHWQLEAARARAGHRSGRARRSDRRAPRGAGLQRGRTRHRGAATGPAEDRTVRGGGGQGPAHRRQLRIPRVVRRRRARLLGRLRTRGGPGAAHPAAGTSLLTEVSFGPGPVPPGAGHLDGPAVGALAARTGVGAVLLTHLQMGFDPAETIASVEASFGGAVTLVAPGERIVIASTTF